MIEGTVCVISGDPLYKDGKLAMPVLKRYN